jgi:hypothetical protein
VRTWNASLSLSLSPRYLPASVTANAQVKHVIFNVISPFVDPFLPGAEGSFTEGMKTVGGGVGVFLLLILLSKWFASRANAVPLRTAKRMKEIKGYAKHLEKIQQQHDGTARGGFTGWGGGIRAAPLVSVIRRHM